MSQMPPPDNPAVGSSPPPWAQPSPYPAGAFQEADEGGGDLMRYFWMVWEHKWTVIMSVAVVLAFGMAKFLSTPPSYQADALMQIETREAGLSALQPFQEYDQILGGSVSVAAEVEVMKSRTIMSAVAEQLRLDIQAVPEHYPWIGAPIARRYSAEGVSRSWFGKDGYAWGGEEIEVQTLAVPDAWLGQPLTLVAGDEGNYRVYDEEGRSLAEGTVGVRVDAQLGDDGPMSLFVSLLKARPGTRFIVTRAPLTSIASGLAASFSAVEQPKYSGVLRVSTTAGDPQQAAAILNKTLDVYQRQNVDRKGAEADQTLEFIEKQLPPLKARLEAAETAYNAYLLEHGSVDISHETRSVLTSIVQFESEIFELQQEREVLRERFKPTHPKIQSLDGLLSTLNDKLSVLEKQTETLPAVQQAVLRLSRDVEVNSNLYSQLINAMQELRIAKAGTVGNARVIDYALPPNFRIAPVLKRTLLIHGLLGLLLGLGIVFLRVKMRHAVEDPAEIERELGLSVFGTVPLSAAQAKLTKRMKKRGVLVSPLAFLAPSDTAVESIRSLRTSLHFLLMDSGNNVLLVSGPSAAVGKSFLSANLAVVLAQTGKRVLLIDADMRRGHLYRAFGVAPGVGLSDYIAASAALDAVVTRCDDVGIDLIGCGKRPPNPSELLMHERFAELVRSASESHDFVIIDAPPILAVTDAAIIGPLAGATLLVARSGVSPMGELEESVKRMRQGGAQVRGFVLNGVELHRGYGYRYGYRYGYGSYGATKE